MNAIDHEHVELLAYACWEQRGRPLGTPDVDWYRALEMLRAECVTEGLPLSAMHVGPTP